MSLSRWANWLKQFLIFRCWSCVHFQSHSNVFLSKQGCQCTKYCSDTIGILEFPALRSCLESSVYAPFGLRMVSSTFFQRQIRVSSFGTPLQARWSSKLQTITTGGSAICHEDPMENILMIISPRALSILRERIHEWYPLGDMVQKEDFSKVMPFYPYSTATFLKLGGEQLSISKLSNFARIVRLASLRKKRTRRVNTSPSKINIRRKQIKGQKLKKNRSKIKPPPISIEH